MIDDLETAFGAFEQHVLRNYVLTLVRSTQANRRKRVSDTYLEWHRENAKPLALRIAALDAAAKHSSDRNTFASDRPLVVPHQQIAAQIRRSPAPSALQKRIDWVATTLHLSSMESHVLATIVRFSQFEPFQQLYQAWFDEGCESSVAAANIGQICNLSRSKSSSLFSRNNLLMQLGLIEEVHGDYFEPSRILLNILRQRTVDPEQLTQALLGKPVPPNLTLSDFEHLGRNAKRVIDIVAGALEAKEHGAALLFYGAPGTGKTEFARLLGQQTGSQVVFVGEMDERLGEPNRADRMAHLALLSALGDRTGRIVLVIDEADDIFCGIDDHEFTKRSGSKVFMNRMVETCPVPTVWISNFPDRMGQSVLRRMVHALEFREPDQAARRRIVDRLARSQNVELAEEHAESLAKLAAAPAIIESGLRAARLAAGDGQLAVEASRTLLKALGRQQPQTPPSTLGFDASLCVADLDLARLTTRVRQAGAGPLSFLLSGPPGTGKSAFARHLASELGLEVLEKRGSDLFGMYVGETEKNIARAFEQAADQNQFLIFDEVDSLLADRSHALRNWEITQVNEMLTWMERHPFPFAATTNFGARLDPATQRRFLFKVIFSPLGAEQLVRTFRRTFGCEPTPDLVQLDLLTPGDFTIVARKAKVLDEHDPEQFVAMLAAEMRAKPGAGREPIGFRR